MHLMLTIGKNLFVVTLTLFLLQSCANWGNCEQFNIDSYEIITGVDIPKVQDANCFSNDSVRITIFQIDFQAPEVQKHYQSPQEYASNYQFETLSASQTDTFEGLGLLEGWTPPNADNQTVFVKNGNSKKYAWNLLMTPDRGELIVEVKKI